MNDCVLRWLVVCVWVAISVSGIDWGLPSQQADRFLFASQPRWDGKTLQSFDAERVDPRLGSDVDRDPVRTTSNVRDAPIVVTSDDNARAQIIRRYRLFSHQPDEMITFMALQQMNPSNLDFDPRLYQYGGLWIYPVGAMLKAANQFGLIELRADKSFYYENPDAFGRFYVVARAYTAMWYALAMIATAMIVTRLTGHALTGTIAAGIVGALPVVFAMAHEAKPHLGGTALMLCAALACARMTRTTHKRDAIAAGVCIGAAAGMVLSAAVALLMLPVAVLLALAPWGKRFTLLTLGFCAAVCAYAVTNPYVIINALTHDPALASNFGNTRAMYQPGAFTDAIRDGAGHFVQALSWPVLIAALGAVVMRRSVCPSRACKTCGVIPLRIASPDLPNSAMMRALSSRMVRTTIPAVAVAAASVLGDSSIRSAAIC